MQYLDYLICLCIFFGGTCVDSLKKLPHVIKYETITPQKLHKLSQTSTEQQKTPPIVTFSLAIDGLNRTLHLERNTHLIGRNFAVVHYSDQGTAETTIPDYKDHCYYHGRIVEVEDSSASIDLCSGINGYVRMEDQSYLIEPLAEEGETDQREGTGEGAGLHAVYNSRHLRRKRSSCGHDYEETVFDHGSIPSGLFRLSKPKSSQQMKKFQIGKTRTVELVLVVDHAEYKKYGSRKTLTARMLAVVNHVDKLYRSLGIRVMLVGLEIWTYRDQIEVSPDPNITLERFMAWRQQTLLPRTKHDNAQFITKVDFIGNTVGLAYTGEICSGRSVAVNEDHNDNAIAVATTLAHEMGHNLGLSHDAPGCVCRSSQPQSGCIMAPSHGHFYPEVFSTCSQDQLAQYLEQRDPACLLETPSTDRIVGGPVCGNAFVEPGEECDCGTVTECKNPCCNATTCKLNAGSKCAEGECCSNCQLQPTGTRCRVQATECDMAEFCSGFSAACPRDAFTQNGRPCDRRSGYCLDGQCPSRVQHCKRLWGPDAQEASARCYSFARKDQKCGTLMCSGGWKFPLTNSRTSYPVPNGEPCHEASIDPKDNFPADLVKIPTGTKCGSNMVCYEQSCQNKKDIVSVYGTEECSDKCNNRGVCNHKRQCHCDPGWATPYCDEKLTEGSTAGMKPSVVIGLSVAAVLVLLFVGFFGVVLWRKKSRGSQKRPRHTSTGEVNPVFQSGQGSPRPRPPSIGKPEFVTSTASQVSRPATQPPLRGGLVPSRAAPEPPKKMAFVAPPPGVQQMVKLSPRVPSQDIDLKNKPPPPARPLPPLQSKTVTKPPPPVPPSKPSGSPSPWTHNQLPAARAALKPPTHLR
ncbi:unnamed protein product [Boreogadus saida]